MSGDGMRDPWQGGYGELAAALAKAQASFPAITRTRTVRVKSQRTGNEYTFKYAPLDTIFDAVRKPLADNGLAITQLIDGTDLVTMLLHSAGATISGRAPLPNGGTVQEFGSAITYLRRYSLQAILGIASEEDDDGNAASGNKIVASAIARQGVMTAADLPDPAIDGLIGTAEKGKGDADFELRYVKEEDDQEPHGLVQFRLVEGRKGWKVKARGLLAELIAEQKVQIEDQRVTCWGSFTDESFLPKGAREPVTYQVLNLTRLKVGVLDLSEPEPGDDLSPEDMAELAQLPLSVPA